ncbi:MAG: DUF799 family lipoprotein [Magnetococcales bacterium]|nr:DUF799 family lipoprotein [Magnetococcales bacterium]
MRHSHLVCLLLVATVLSACGPTMTNKIAEFPHMYDDRRPLSILILPPINKTTASDAKELYSTTTAVPITEHGYYFFPPAVVFDLMKQDGIFDTELLKDVPPQTFKQKFGADAILLVEITDWTTSYVILSGSVTVGIDMTLRSTSTGEDIWKRKIVEKVDTSGGNNSSGGIAGLVVKLAVAAAQTASTDYVPIARMANAKAIGGMPYGKYHPLFDKDRTDQITTPSAQKRE